MVREGPVLLLLIPVPVEDPSPYEVETSLQNRPIALCDAHCLLNRPCFMFALPHRRTFIAVVMQLPRPYASVVTSSFVILYVSLIPVMHVDILSLHFIVN